MILNTPSRLALRRSLVASSAPLLRLLRPLLTSRSGLHRRPFRHEARSPQVRTHSFIAQPPDLRRLTLGHKSFAVICPLALVRTAFYLVLVHRLAIYAPRFLPTLGHPHAVALHFAHCDQLAGGLAPPGVRPCWAHKRNAVRVYSLALVAFIRVCPCLPVDSGLTTFYICVLFNVACRAATKKGVELCRKCAFGVSLR